MAYRRTLSTRASLIARRYHPSLSYLLHNGEDRRDNSFEERPCQEKLNPFLQQRSFLSTLNSSAGFSAAVRGRGCLGFSLSPSSGSPYCRYMSTTVGGNADNIDLISDVADVLTDTTVQAVASQAPMVNEVAIAAADSYYPVMYLQYFIDYVHQLSGLNWWASIVLTTLLIRGLTLPLLINQLKATSKLAIIRPRMEEIKNEMQEKSMDPTAVTEGQRKLQQLFTESGVSPFTPLKGIFIQAPVFISFFLAVTNMAEKVPSFKNGGAYWFTDLTTPDSLYILPILTALSFLITVEFNMQEGMEGNPSAGTIKNVSRVFAVLTVPLTMSFPKAIFCYWVTSNLFSLVYGYVLKKSGLKKYLGIPEIPVTPPTTTSKPAFSVFSVLKQPTPMTEQSLSVPTTPSKLADRKVSSSAVLSQRLRSLEKEVKGRKKNKKR
ncbi:mitochondrial inner membrane protein OXA1-like [Punica granatum]|uniref:Mitochondrial inner membrane protein OXA1-like n=2 Tax=Punica granatum TaxID=22663 RepID=A0A6P8D997_PUNGR|nr:mitochondrial inner membrane protein OXA1-like [Punica granatum]